MRKNYIEVASSMNVVEFGLMKATLRNSNIVFLTKDEHTTQTQHIGAMAIGGAKLYVHQEDYEDAIAVLKIAGYNVYEPIETEIPYLADIAEWLQKIPVLNTLKLELQLLIAGLSIAALGGLLIFVLTLLFS